ncbi:MAG: caspase family protein [Phaeodactylibacter sp.]|nr:caspase family protein [Phaeodactylibacter sp.]MCB9300784.1 caspase family protein [Lewinellaceae bacterium]
MAKEVGKKKGIDIHEAASHIRRVRSAWFLGFGIDNYPNFPKLENASRDVKQIAAVLQEQYQFDPEHVILLLNEEATRAGIINKLDEMVGLLSAENDLIIYYSGHGHLNPQTQKGFWIPFDAQPGSTADFIPNSTIKSYMEDIPAFHTFLISDACFSGSLFVEGKMRSAGNEAIEELDSRASRWALCSGRHDEEVYDGNPGENSPFANSILSELRQSRNSELNVGRLIDNVVMQTRAHYRQLPEGNPMFDVGHQGGQFIFRLKFDDARDWAAAEAENAIPAYENYLALYPEGQHMREAKEKLLELNDEASWKVALEKDSIVAYENYLEQFPKGRHDIEARSRIQTTKEEQEWGEAQRVDEVWGYQSYLEKYPKGKYVPAANNRITALQQGASHQASGAVLAKEDQVADIVRIPRGYLIGGGLLVLAIVIAVFSWLLNGSKKGKLSYDQVLKSEEYGDYWGVRQGKKWGYYNRVTQSLILPQYDEIQPFVKEMALVKLDGKYGWINKQNSPIIPIQYDQASRFNDKGMAVVELKGKSFSIDRSGAPMDSKSPEDRQEMELYETALGKNTVPAYQSYLDSYPKGRFVPDVQKYIAIKQQEEQSAWEMALKMDRGESYNKYLAEYPGGKYETQAQEALKRFYLDTRDSRYYRTVELGGQLWMAQNLNYQGSGLCYNKQDTICEKTGKLYTWEEAMKACPEGWRVPTDDEWWSMTALYGKAFSYSRNKASDAGQNAYQKLVNDGDTGFKAELGGQFSGGQFSQLGQAGYYWSSIRDSGSGEALIYSFDSKNGVVARTTDAPAKAFSCRCVKEE